MIRRPRPGQRVRLHYAGRTVRAELAPRHGRAGAVLVVGGGPGPLNALVLLDGGGAVVVPRGNLVAEVPIGAAP